MRTIQPTVCRAEPRSSAHSHHPRAEPRLASRRDSLARLALLPVAVPALWAPLQQTAQAAEAPVSASPAAAPAPPKVKAFIGREFFFQYNPDNYVVRQDPSELNPTPGEKETEQHSTAFFFTIKFRVSNELILPFFTSHPTGRQGEKPIRADVVSRNPSSGAKITVVRSQAAKLKQSFYQVTDVSQLGSPKEVIDVLLPPTTRILAASTATFPQPPRDTGTVLGVIDRDPVTIYRYEVILPTGQHAAVAVGAMLGYVFLMGASAPEEEWAGVADEMRAVAATFKILPK
jgi:hypothetical protein